MAAWRVRRRADAGGTRDAAASPDQG